MKQHLGSTVLASLDGVHCEQESQEDYLRNGPRAPRGICACHAAGPRRRRLLVVHGQLFRVSQAACRLLVKVVRLFRNLFGQIRVRAEVGIIFPFFILEYVLHSL